MGEDETEGNVRLSHKVEPSAHFFESPRQRTDAVVAHHLRHSFAVGRLLRWYRDDGDPAANLMKLSTFMRHVDPTSTAVYLTITAELLDSAARRFERFAAPLSSGSRS